MLTLNNNILNNIKKHAATDSPNECCGLIYSSGDNNYVFPSINISQNKRNSFTISPVDYINASEQGKIVAFYHSHCGYNSEFSECDKYSSLNYKLPLVLYDVQTDKFKIFNDKDNKFNKYLGIKFEYGQNDCFSLIQEFYSNEFEIKLPDIQRNKNWYENNSNLIIENISSFGFHSIEQPKYGDIILVRRTDQKLPRHLMIYLKNDTVLHNSLNSYSVIESYSYAMKLQTHTILRHKSLWS